MGTIRYFKLDSAEQAEALSRLMWSLCHDGSSTCTHLFEWYADGTIKLNDMVIPVYMKADFQQTLEQMKVVLNGYLSDEEGQRIAALLRTGKANVLDLVPAGLNEKL
jgi:hypothetical protein